MSHVFLSYASEDRDRVEPLVRLLSDVAPVWWDQKIRHGEHWEDAVERAVEQAACVVVAWTAESVKSGWVKSEAADARDRGILVPVLMDPVKIPLAFRHVETAQLQEWDGSPEHPEARALRESVQAIVARAGQAPTAGSGAGTGPPVPPPPPRRAPAPRRRSRALAVLAVAGALALGGYAAARALQGSAGDGGATAGVDSPGARTAADPGPPAPAAPDSPAPGGPVPLRVEGIVISETETPTLRAALSYLSKEGEGRGYHYLVDVDGGVYAFFDESRRAGHTRELNASTLGVGMVHVTERTARATRREHRPYTEEQIDGLVRLLATLAHDHRLNVQSIRSKEEVSGRYPREITARMDEVRMRVSRLLAQWRLEGRRPPEAEVRLAPP